MALRLIRNVAFVVFASGLLVSHASAQTTLTLTTADTQVTDTTIGSGTAASFVYNTDVLTTRAASDVNLTRRALLKFDTETTIPAGTPITSARLTVYVKRGAGAATRKIGVYPVTTSFQESQATWVTRKTGYTWATAGGDLGVKSAEMPVTATANTAITVDVTAIVKAQQLGSSSRYTRLGLIDLDAKDSSSYREFHSSEAGSAALRPKLVVVYGVSSGPAVPPPSGTTLKVLDWNTHYGGGGTDGRWDVERVVDFIVRLKPDVISLNELTRYAYYDTATDHPAKYAALLKAKTGQTWYYTFRTDSGASTGVGNAVFSRFPFASTSYCQLSARRVAVNAAIHVNGRLVNIWSTHLDSSSTSNSMRTTEVRALHACTAPFAEQRIVAGDFNAKAGSSEIALMKTMFKDAWEEADKAPGVDAISYPGNTSFGATRNSRIDYVFYSKTAANLVLKRAEVFDSRDANGVAPSDHKPLMVTFEVR